MKKFLATTPLHRIFFYLTCALLPVQLGFHFWPSWAMILGRRVDYLSPTIYLTDIFVIATLISWGIRTLRERNKVRIHPLLVFGIFIILINTAFSKNIPVSLYQWMKAIECILLGFYIIKTKPKFEHVVTALSIAILYSSLIAIVQFILQRAIGGPLWLLGERTFFADTPGIAQISLCDFSGQSCRLFLRPYGTFPHPNVLGGFLAVTLPFLLYVISHANIRTPNVFRNVMIISFAAGICALVLTFGRSAWVAASIGILFIIYGKLRITRNTSHKKYIHVLLIGGFLLATLGVAYFSRNLPGSESIVVRNDLNIAALKMTGENLLFGVGWGNFLTALPHYMTIRTIYFLQPVHNIYLLTLSQLGIVGIVFIFVCSTLIKKHIRNIFSVTGVSFLLVLLLGTADHYFLTLEQGQLMFAITIGLYFATIGARASPTT